MLRGFIAMLVGTNSEDKGYRTSCAQNLPVTPAPVWTYKCHLYLGTSNGEGYLPRLL